jgi:hypothetical protein
LFNISQGSRVHIDKVETIIIHSRAPARRMHAHDDA